MIVNTLNNSWNFTNCITTKRTTAISPMEYPLNNFQMRIRFFAQRKGVHFVFIIVDLLQLNIFTCHTIGSRFKN